MWHFCPSRPTLVLPSTETRGGRKPLWVVGTTRPLSTSDRRKRTLRLVAGAVAGPSAALLLCYCAFRLHFNLSTAGSIDLLVVVLTALRFGFWEATGSSLAGIA